MKLLCSLLCGLLAFNACQPPPDNSSMQAFEQNSKTALKMLKDFQNESLDHASVFAPDALARGTGFNDPDSIVLTDIIKYDKQNWKKYDFEIVSNPLIMLPGVNANTKMADGSVRCYADWKITLTATDSTEERSGVLKLYQSFDFNEEGKIVYEQTYGDFTGLLNYLMKDSKDRPEEMEESEDM